MIIGINMSTPPDMHKHWFNRRIHAYIALAWIILQTLMWIALAILHPAAFSLLYTVIGFSYMIPTGILTAYYGGSSFQDYIDKVKQ